MKSKYYHSSMLMLGLALANTGRFKTNFTSNEEIEYRKKQAFKFKFNIPKGTRLYLFENDGTFESFPEFSSRNEMPNYCVFYTIALNDKSAINKYSKWRSANNGI